MSSPAPAGLMFFAGVQDPSFRAEPRGQGAELADHRAALRRVRELLPGREAHRELGIRPVMSQAGQRELPLQKVLKLGRVDVGRSSSGLCRKLARPSGRRMPASPYPADGAAVFASP